MSADLEDTLTVGPPRPAPSGVEPDSEPTMQRARVAVPPAEPNEPVAMAAAPTPAAQQYFGFRLGRSEIVLLDAIAYLGRKPAAPRVVRGGRARLVRVTSATNEVSATHLELRQAGSTVVVHDLNSTNGTRVAVPGQPVQALRPGESLVVSPGTLIDIGDRNVIEIVPMREKPMREKK